jgi:hypothetical protein
MIKRLAKVRFELDMSDWHGHGSETLWAEPIGEHERRILQIRNSPFFAKGINNLDVVKAEFTEKDVVGDFIEVIERGGHSTYMLLIQPTEIRILSYWSILEGLGCSYESMRLDLSIGSRLLYSVDVPPTTDIHEVYEIFERGQDQGVWMFQEGYAHTPGSPRPTPMAM